MSDSSSQWASNWASIRRGLRTAGRFYRAHTLLPIATLILGVGLVVLITIIAPNPPGEGGAGGWWVTGLIAAILLAVAGFAGLVVRSGSKGETRAQKIGRLTRALNEASQAIAQITTEMEDGEYRLRELEKQTSVQQQLANLSTPQAEAIREALKGELGRESRKGLMRDLVFLVVGLIGGLVLTRLFT